MSDLSSIFKEGCKVVISPDKMRAWIVLAPPRGVTYTAEAVQEWLRQKGVTHGADAALIRTALASGRYDDMLEVARGKAPVPAAGGDYVLKVDKRPFTGLNGASDGSLYYDDLSFLQEVQPGQVLAELTPPTAAEAGMTVTGEVLQPRAGTPGRVLEGDGFEVAPDGRSVIAPMLAHVNIVNDQLILTPLKRLPKLAEADGPVEFAGNILVEGDVTAGSIITATGSVFIAGRAVSAQVKAGNNVLISGGMRSEGGYGRVEAGVNVWGLFFETCEIEAGGEICANHLAGCEAKAGGRVTALGGRAAIYGTTLYARGGVVAGKLGDGTGISTSITAGLDRAFIDAYNTLDKKTERLGIDVNALQQNILAFERLNRMKPDKGKNDPKYKEMLAKRDQSLSVQKILTDERTKMKRTLEQASAVSIIARETAYPGVSISIDTRTMNILSPMQRTRFRRSGEDIEAIAGGER